MGKRNGGAGVILGRAIVYATLFVGLVLVFLPARLLGWSGVTSPTEIRVGQATGMLVAAVGAALALWCVLTFALAGKGMPAPFDPPRRLVVRGPYRFVRNPMYLGAALALAGAALFYESAALAVNGGTKIPITIAHQFWGDRTTWIMDPSGHMWTIASRVEETTEDERQALFSRILAADTKPREITHGG